ncbi:MAG: glycosyltransferase family 39 protein [Bacteroidota bacterium]
MADRFPQIILVFLFAFFGLVLFAHLDDPQLEFYDEARRAVSALEMARGDAPSWLTPPYYGAPDHWGTKPPLLVWSQALWMKVLGPGELAVRLPSALATLALCFLLTWWGKRDWGSPLAGALGALAVVLNWHFMGNHGARTGDFDALLVLFLTSQVICFYRWIASGQLKWLWLAGAAVFLAGMTKGVAGGFLLPGIGLWLLVDQQGRKKLLHPGLYSIIGGAIGLVVGYYFLREQVDPGYLELVYNNELGGRYQETNENHRGPWYFYLRSLVMDPGWCHLVGLLIPGLVFLLSSTGYRRQASMLGITAVVFLGIISMAATKLYWYQSPALPLLGMLIGAGIYHLAALLKDSIGGQRGSFIGIALVTGLMISPSVLIVHRVLNAKIYQETPLRKAAFRAFMRHPAVNPPYAVLIDNYNPNARFYVEQAREKGKDVTLRRRLPLGDFLSVKEQPADGTFSKGDRVMVCHTSTWDHMFKRYQPKEIVGDGRCKLVEVSGDR